jgi:plasmid stability protein
MSKQLTIRGVSEAVGRRLESVSRAKGQSVNATVLEILAAAVGEDERRRRLTRYVTWDQADLAEFNQSLEAQRSVDDSLWR